MSTCSVERSWCARVSDLARPLTLPPPFMAGEAQGHRYGPAWNQNRMDAFLVSTAIVALAEIGDKTQLLAFILAAKFRRPWPIVAGILIATLLNHAFAAALGTWLTSLMAPQTLRWVLALSFIAMAVWTLLRHPRRSRYPAREKCLPQWRAPT